jgi:hypothetical protein
MIPMSKPLVWIAGDCEHRDFAAVRAWLAEHAQASPAADDAGFPRAIVVFQSRVGQVSQDEIGRLRQRAPLAQLIAVVGSLCSEGKPRPGSIWQGVTRLYWHQALARLPSLLSRQGPAPKRGAHAGLVAICSPKRGQYQALADVCWAGGWRSVWYAPGQPSHSRRASAVLVEGWESLPAQRLAAPAILLLDFPRAEDRDRAAGLGIHHLLARPLLVADLLATLDSLAAQPNSAIHAA